MYTALSSAFIFKSFILHSYQYSRYYIMRTALSLTFLLSIIPCFSPLVGNHGMQITKELILDLWNQPDDKSNITEGFKDWTLSDGKVTLEIILSNGEKFSPPPFILKQKLINGKYLMWLVDPPGAPFKNYIIVLYEKHSKLYHKFSYRKTEGRNENIEEVVHFIGIRYPNTNLYAFTQTNTTKMKEKALYMELHTKKMNTFEEVITDANNKWLRTYRGKFIPIVDSP